MEKNIAGQNSGEPLSQNGEFKGDEPVELHKRS